MRDAADVVGEGSSCRCIIDMCGRSSSISGHAIHELVRRAKVDEAAFGKRRRVRVSCSSKEVVLDTCRHVESVKSIRRDDKHEAVGQGWGGGHKSLDVGNPVERAVKDGK